MSPHRDKNKTQIGNRNLNLKITREIYRSCQNYIDLK